MIGAARTTYFRVVLLSLIAAEELVLLILYYLYRDYLLLAIGGSFASLSLCGAWYSYKNASSQNRSTRTYLPLSLSLLGASGMAVMAGLVSVVAHDSPSPLRADSAKNDYGEKFSLGVTQPISLLKFRYLKEAPSYCRRERIFGQIKDFARAAGCTTVDTTAIDGVPLEMVSCILTKKTTDNCPSTYYAEIWQERWWRSSEDYELLMFARVRTVCEREQDFRTFRASDEIEDAARDQTEQMRRLFRSCDIKHILGTAKLPNSDQDKGVP
jgi:hypothetical protein